MPSGRKPREPRRWWTPVDIAKFLGITPERVREYLRNNERLFRSGHHYKWDRWRLNATDTIVVISYFTSDLTKEG